jgi:hypothetical protein
MKKYHNFINEKIGELNIEPYPILVKSYIKEVASEAYYFNTEKYLYALLFTNNPSLMSYFTEGELRNIEFFKDMSFERIKEEMNKATGPSFMIRGLDEIEDDYKYREIVVFGDVGANLEMYCKNITYYDLINDFDDTEITNEQHPMKIMSTIGTILREYITEKKIKYLFFGGSISDDKEYSYQQRMKMYLAIIKRNLPNAIWIEIKSQKYPEAICVVKL